jgi:type VI secretion system secreted protein VgrG
MGDNSDGGDEDNGGGDDLTTTRDIWVTTSLDDGVIALERMDGHETLGQPFSYDLSLLSTDWNIDLSTLLGKPMTVHVKLPAGGTRHFNGIVTRATRLDVEDRYARYAVTLQPWLALLDFQSDCRIYQNISIPNIVKEVFRRADFSDFEDSLDETYNELEYVVQYRESDFNFVSRLMQHAGIYYFFKHVEDKHTLVLADSQGAHDTVDDYEEVEFRPQKETSRGETEHLSSWVVAQQIRSGGYAATDFDFKAPRTALLSALSQPQKYAHAETELFEYPGDFLKKDDGDAQVKRRLEERQYEYEMVQASGDVRGLGSGDLFTLIDYPRDDQNKEYLVVGAAYNIHVGDYASDGVGDDEFRGSLKLLDSKTPFRPAIRAAKHRVEGPQTAIVVGPSGDEIHTDNYGRVMVQFHWDRYGMSDERSSCWVRVSQAWAGAKWGAMHIPRIGQEVIVDFLEGDPDRPIITGRVYNADNMPPYDLPANKTQSGIKSRSTMGGAPSNFNEIRFEDKKGAELVNVQAEKDLTSLVKHDEDRNVGNDRTTEIGHDETITVGNNRTETVTKQESITIGGDRQESVGKSETVSIGTTRALTVGSDETIQVGGKRTDSVAKDETTTVGGNQNLNVGKNQSVSVGGGLTLSVAKDDNVSVTGNLTVSVGKGESRDIGKKLTVTAGDQITLTSGSASITLKSNGDITINGANITLKGSGKINIQASSDVVIKGSKVSQN